MSISVAHACLRWVGLALSTKDSGDQRRAGSSDYVSEGRRDVKASESQEHTSFFDSLYCINNKKQRLKYLRHLLCDLIYVQCKIIFLPITKISVYKSFICSNMQSTLKLTELLYLGFLFHGAHTATYTQTHQTFAKKDKLDEKSYF